MAEKYNELGLRMCDQGGCNQPATHWLVWTKPQVYCLEHMERVLGIAEAMGHPTPAATLRPIFPAEAVKLE